MAKKKKEVKKKSKEISKVTKFYKRYYKVFMIFPVLLLLVSIGFIVQTYNHVKSPIYRDVSLKGGLSLILEINPTININQLEQILQKDFKDNSFAVSALSENGKEVGYIIDSDMKEKVLKAKLEDLFKIKLEQGKNYNSNYISPSLSNSFFKQAMIALGFSFLFMSLVVFLYFKEMVPSTAVVLSAIFDILVTVGILDYMKYKISVAGLGTIIMLVGYSIDTDVLLTNRLIKEPGDDYFGKSFFAFKTGSLMSLTTLIAGLGAMFITNSSVIFEIAMILVIGLIVDYISTWIQNTGILLWWLEMKKDKH